MPVLQVRNFSCINHARFEPTDLTVVIGPQGSGKSVLCKLSYFFNYSLRQIPQWLSDSEIKTVDSVFGQLERQFVEWFPAAAWGADAFKIDYSAGTLQFEVVRGKSRGSERARFVRTKNLVQLIEAGLDLAAVARSKSRKSAMGRYDALWTTQSSVHEEIVKALANEDFYETYIPAGRSFFTSVGKIVTALAGGSMLEPVVSIFGQNVANWRDQPYFITEYRNSQVTGPFRKLLGGDVVSEVDGKEFIATSDGRKVPISSLSSGQQELLPLYFAFSYMGGPRARSTYLEEPEAHLFPDAQAQLVQLLVEMVNGFTRRTGLVRKKKDLTQGLQRLMLTTHSPYVLSKLNNLVKAGQLGVRRGPARRQQLEEILPSASWIYPGTLTAYAIHNRNLVPIIDDEGFIDASYIDHVSQVTGQEFDRLLDVEFK